MSWSRALYRVLRRQRIIPLMALLAVLLAASACLASVPAGLPSSPATPQVIVRAASAPTDAWNHGAGQKCTDCHASSEKPQQFDWRNIPPGEASPEAEEEGEGPRLRLDFFVAQRAYPKTTLPEGARIKAFRQTLEMASQLSGSALSARWVSIGPAPMKNSAMGQQNVDVSGRVKALAVDPRNSNVVYLGAAQGGVWKTTDGGASWQPLTDKQPSLAVSALALDPRNPDTIYVGTGEPHPGLDNYYGAGILKSTDGGATWQQLGADTFTGLGIASIVIDPNNSNVIYVASSRTGVEGSATPVRGVFKSTNGGSTWTALLTCQDCYGASDLVMDPRNPSTLYAAFWSYGIFKSTNGGANWTQLTNGLPGSNFRRVELAISPSNPLVLYAGYDYSAQGQYEGALLFKTVDGGSSWTWLQQAPNYCTGQCWYDNIIAVSPTNPNVVYLGGSANYQWQPVTRIKEVVVRSSDGGTTWQDMSPNDSVAHTLHPDMHAIAFDPQNPNTIWVGNDGGVWKSTDGGRTWVNRNTNLATLQFTGIALHPTNASIVFGGMQDNNKAKTTGATAWDALDVGDGGYAAIDPFNPQYYYGSRYGISFQRNDQGGTAPVDDWPIKTNGINQQDRALFYAPFALDPSTAGVAYYGTYRLYRTTNRGDDWTPISGDLTKGAATAGSISTIAVAPSDPRTIYVGTSDGNVQVTTNTGGSWTNVTKAPLPNRWVSEIAVAHNAPRTAYVVFNGFNIHTPDTPGHVFKTTDGGATWQNISSNLPDVPVLSIVLDRDAPGIIYIGTDVGVFRSTNDGASWAPFNDGLPNVAVVDLALNPNTDILVAATHGRSVYKVQLGEAEPTPTPTRTPSPTPTRPRFTPIASIYMPQVVKGLSLPTSTPTVAGTTFPTQTPTATPTISPTPTPTRTPGGATPTPTRIPSPRVYFDNFSNPASGWATGSMGFCQYAYSGGEYRIGVSQFNWICMSSAPTDPQINGTYSVEARKVSSADGSIYGLLFGLDSPSSFDQFYVFWVDPADQTYLLQRYDHGTWTDIVGWESSFVINAKASTNMLKVRRQGEQITLYANGVDLATVADNAFPDNGYMGVAVWAGYNVGSAITYFDDFKVTVPTLILSDDFSNPDSGWPVGVTTACQASYAGGEYQTATQPNYACVFRGPGGSRPDGLFEVTVHRGESIYPTAYGLMFGEDGTFSTFYAFLVIPDTQEYVLAKYQGGWWALTWDEEDNDAWTYSSAINPGMADNALQVERDSTRISLYVNDTYLETVNDASLLGDGYFGVVNWASEYAPVIAYFDDFRLTVWDEPSALGLEAGSRAAVGELNGERRAEMSPGRKEPPTVPYVPPPKQKSVPQHGELD